MALPLTTTISAFLAPSSAAPSCPPSPMEDDNQCPLFKAIVKLTHSLIDFWGEPPLVYTDFCSFLTNTTPDFPQGIPHALGLHIAPAPLSEVLTAQAELIRALTAEVRRLAAIVHERLLPPQAQAPIKGPTKPPVCTPSFASAVKVPARPSLVLTPAPGSSPVQAVQKTPSELCTYLNGVLLELFPGTSLSAARWTKNNNLVIVAGPDTTSHHLQKASAILSLTVSHFIAANTSKPVSISTLHLTRLPSWVKRPDSYAVGSSSSLVLSFEDPMGDTLRTLLAQKRLFAFGQADFSTLPSPPTTPGLFASIFAHLTVLTRPLSSPQAPPASRPAVSVSLVLCLVSEANSDEVPGGTTRMLSSTPDNDRKGPQIGEKYMARLGIEPKTPD
ncbi:hypothetical protein EDB86DRAFT_3244459 [Lactarius hatsudake]|nr:hypothetical protein EDB86DRAFT_3244459 [Lactarius hatsudake]